MIVAVLSLSQFLAFSLFVTPLPIADSRWKLLWLLPITLGLSIVYKSIRCEKMRQVPVEAAQLFFTILAFIVLGAAVLRGALWLSQM